MKNKIFAKLLIALGLVVSIGAPVWATSTQIAVLKSQCGESMLDKIGVTLSGAVAIGCIVLIVVWKYISAVFREKLKGNRTPFIFMFIGFVVVSVIQMFAEALESILFWGAVGSLVAVICYYFADKLTEEDD